MGIKDWWDSALGLFRYSEHHDISEFKGKRFGVDISIFLNQNLSSDVDKLACTSNPVYPSPDLLQHIMEIHRYFSKWFTPVYVFDGLAPDVKKSEKEKRLKDREKAGSFYNELRACIR